MRRTLIVVLFLAIAVAMALPVWAELNWSMGITLTEKEAGVSMGTRIAAVRITTNSFDRTTERVFGSWLSATNFLPEMTFAKGIGYNAYADFAGIRNVERVVVSPDSGMTEWEATQEKDWGWKATLCELPPGPHALQWGVYSRDKHNRLILFIIPINWNSGRSNQVVQQFNVRRMPTNCENYSDEDCLAFLKGFISVDAQMDPQYLAMKQARAQLERAAQQQNPQPVPVQKTLPETAMNSVPQESPSNFDIIFADGGKMTGVCLVGEPYIGRRLGVFTGDSLIGVINVDEYRNRTARSSSSSRFLKEYQDREEELKVEWLEGGMK